MAPSRSRPSPVVSDADGSADNAKPWKKCRNKAAIYAAQLNEVVDELKLVLHSLPTEFRPEFVAQVRRNVDSLLTSCQLHGTVTNDRTVTGNKQAAMTLLADVEPLHKFAAAHAPASQCCRVLAKAVGVLRPLQMTPRDQKHVTAAEKRKAHARGKHAAAPAARSRTRSRGEARPTKAATPAALAQRMCTAMRRPIEDRTDDDDSSDSSSDTDSDDDDAFLAVNKAHRPHPAVSLEDSLAESSARRMAAGHLVATASDGDADYDEDESEDTDTYSYTDTGASTSDMQSPAHLGAAAPEMTLPPYDYAMYGAEAYAGAEAASLLPSLPVTSAGPVLAEPSLPPTHDSPFYPVRSGSSMLPVLSARPSTDTMFESVHPAGTTQAAGRQDSWSLFARAPGAFSEFTTLSNESPSVLYLTDDLSTPYAAPTL